MWASLCWYVPLTVFEAVAINTEKNRKGPKGTEKNRKGPKRTERTEKDRKDTEKDRKDTEKDRKDTERAIIITIRIHAYN